MGISRKALLLLGSTALGFAVSGFSGALADDVESSGAIETVVVTAEKRAENVQKMAIAITALSGADLQQRQIANVSDLSRAEPGLVISDATGGGPKQASIRGIGTANSMPGGDPGVAISIDGHYIQDSGFVLRDLLDVARVEVLRGPQGTLYGRNATGGAINVITNRPTPDFNGYVAVGAGNFGERNVTGVLNGTVSGDLLGRVAVALNRNDGYVENISPVAPQRHLLNTDSINAIGTLLYDFSPDFQARLSAYGYQNTGDIFIYRVIGDLHAIGGVNFSHLPADYVNPTNTDPNKVRYDTPTVGYDRAMGLSLNLDWNLGWVQLRSLSAVDNSATKMGVDLDSTDATPPVTWGENYHYTTFSQELHALFDGANYKALLGLYAYGENSVFTRDFNAPAEVYVIDYRYVYDPRPALEGQSYAVFGNIDYNITDNVILTAGGRYSYDSKSMKRGFQVISNALGGVILSTYSDLHTSWQKLTWRFALRYDISDTKSIYASYSRGYKPGGFNAISTDDPSYRPETVTAYEVGFKSLWFDDHLRVNLAAFRNAYKDKQELVLQLGAPNANTETTIKNAAAATIQGIELEYLAKFTNSFSTDGAISYLYANYDTYSGNDTSRPSLGLVDLAGHKLPNAPVWAANFGAQYNTMLWNGNASVRLDYSWKAPYFSNAFNRRNGPNDFGLTDYVPANGFLSASISWIDAESLWEVTLYGRNLTDNVALTYIQPAYAGGSFANYTVPRTYGVKLTRNF
jgi:iron complex outermembrane receptor protein